MGKGPYTHHSSRMLSEKVHQDFDWNQQLLDQRVGYWISSRESVSLLASVIDNYCLDINKIMSWVVVVLTPSPLSSRYNLIVCINKVYLN